MDASRAARSDDGPAPQVAAGEYRFGQVLCTQMIAMALRLSDTQYPKAEVKLDICWHLPLFA